MGSRSWTLRPAVQRCLFTHHNVSFILQRLPAAVRFLLFMSTRCQCAMCLLTANINKHVNGIEIHLQHDLRGDLWGVQTSQVVKQYYRCLEEGSPYKDNEWARMQAECSSQGPTKPANRGTPGGPPRGGPGAYASSQGGRGNAGAGRGDCFRCTIGLST